MMRDILISMRPQQWAKNIFVFAAVVFTGQMFVPPRVVKSLGVFVLLCALSGAGYLLNDLRDRPNDREHPRKRLRPIAAGRVPVWVASALAGILIPVSLGAGFLLNPKVGWTLAVYVMLTLAYSGWLKQLVIVDVIAVALGYVLRVLAGGFSVEVTSTPWSLACTFFLALMISIGKRVAEKRGPGRIASQRAVLENYSKDFLNQMLLVSAMSTITAYALFTFTSGKNVNLMLTTPFVVYGVLRYLWLVDSQAEVDVPEMLVLRDRPLLLNSVLWGILAVAVLYIVG
jgi:4-hydroxybenzoate polyprenyltransferase